MTKISRCFFGLFTAMLWPSISMLCAAEPLSNATSSQNAVSSTSEAAPSEIDSAVRMAQEEVRDPFAMAPEAEVAASAPSLAAPAGPGITVVLQGIGFGSRDAYAVIGGDVYYSGDEKNGIKLLEVRRREVDVLVNGGKVTVPLFPDQYLKNAKERAEKKSAMKNASIIRSSNTHMPLFPSKREQPSL